MHMCFLYGNEEERLRVLARFYEAGRLAGERLTYAYEGDSDAEVRRGLRQYGLTDDATLRTRRSEDLYFLDGELLPDRMLEITKQIYENAIAEGFTGARSSGELAWGNRGTITSRQALEYEARLTDVLLESPATVVCQYDVRRFDGGLLMDILSVHPYTVVRGQVVMNPYFVEPAKFLERLRGQT
jgi:hypothetical protein